MTSRELNLTLISHFPELAEEYREYVSWQEGDDTGSHCVYGDIFANYAIDIINKQNDAAIMAVFSFIEGLLRLHDEYVDNVIQLSVLEQTWTYVGTKDIMVYQDHIGKRTSEVFQTIGTYLH